MFSSLQFSPWTNWVIGVTWGTIQHRSSSSLFCRRPLWAGPAWVGKSTLILSIQHFLPTLVSSTLNKVPWKMVLERLSWSVTHPNHASFHLLTVARRGSCGPARELILLHTQLLVLCSKLDMQWSSGTWPWKPGSFFLFRVSRCKWPLIEVL